MTRKIISAILLTAILAGCASCGSGTPDSGNDTTVSKDTTTGGADMTAEWVNPGIDFDGETFTIATHQWESPWQIAKYNQITPDEENGDVINDALVRRRRWVEEKFNLKLENFKLAERNSVNELVNVINAGEDAVDFGMVMAASMSMLMGAQNLVVNLASINSIDFTNSWWDENATREMTMFGKQYAALGDVSFFIKGAQVATFFNKNMIETYQLDDPYQLVEEGKWTLDNYFSMAEAVAHDLNGNSKVDEEDSFGLACGGDAEEGFLLGCDVRYSKHDSENIEITIMGERTVNALEKIDKFMKTKSVVMTDKTFSTANNVWFELFIPTLADSRSLFYVNQLYGALNMRSMDVDFGVLPMPKYDEEQKNYTSTSNTWFTDFLVIPLTNQDLERTGAVIEAMGYYSAQNVTPAFIDNVVMNKALRDEQSAEMVRILYDTMQYDVVRIFNWGGITNTVLKVWQSSDTPSFSSIYASSESAIKEAVEKVVSEFKGE